MGLGLGVLTALLVLLPGIAFVLGLTRLHNPSKPATPFDQHFSIGLISSLVAALVFHVVWIFLCNLASSFSGLVVDPAQVLPLLSGDIKPPVGDAAVGSVSNYPYRIAFYFLSITVSAWFLGKRLNRMVRPTSPPTWLELLRPAHKPDFVWLTVDMKLDNECYLIAGAVQHFNVDKLGVLDRVVISGAMRRPLHCDEATRTAASTMDGWTEIAGEFLVIQMQHVRTINVDYWYIDDESEPGIDLDTVADEDPSG